MKQYSIVYKNKPEYKGADLYLADCSPPDFSSDPKEAVLFDFVSEASMLFELEEYRTCDENHLDGEIMERIEKISFKEIK